MCYFPSNCVAYFSFAVSIGILVSVVFYLVSLFSTGLVSFLSTGLAASYFLFSVYLDAVFYSVDFVVIFFSIG